MRVDRVVIPAALVLALAGGTANAAQRGGARRGGHDTGRTATARAPERAAAPRSNEGARANGRARENDRARQNDGTRQNDGARANQARPRVARPRVETARPRVETVRPRNDRTWFHEDNRSRNYRIRPRVYVTPRVVRPYRRHVYARPYYVFRPRVSIGLGIWVGEPVPYPVYGYPYPYTYPYPDPAYPPPPPPYPDQPYPDSPDPSAYPAQPNVVSPSAVGGVSFEITPDDAEVYVDGQDVGEVGDFTPSSEPLSLSPGRHHIELQAPGYIPMALDVDVVAGEVVPYRGDLRRE